MTPQDTIQKQKQKQLIFDIDELAKRQQALEAARQQAQEAIVADQKWTAITQNLLHTSLQRLAALDDDICHARFTSAAKANTLHQIRAITEEAAERTLKLEEECNALHQQIEDESGPLLIDLQRRLLQAGYLPGTILQIQEEAISSNTSDERNAPPKRKSLFSYFKR